MENGLEATQGFKQVYSSPHQIPIIEGVGSYFNFSRIGHFSK